MDLCRRLFEMEAAPNQRNAVASLTDDLLLDISFTSRPATCSPTNVSVTPRTTSSSTTIRCRIVAAFFYDSENGNRNFTSIVPSVRSPSLEFLPFNIDKVAILYYYNGLILCWCLGADGYRYVVCNSIT